MEIKKELKELEKNDVIAIIFAFDYLKAIVIGNNGSGISWHSEKWHKSSSIFSSYDEMNKMKWQHIGRCKYILLFFRKIFLF